MSTVPAVRPLALAALLCAAAAAHADALAMVFLQAGGAPSSVSGGQVQLDLLAAVGASARRRRG